ncbi:hypothetical protein EJ05DRAFT_505837 [Pseudovirgaria hyperparasitica]|uniref:ferric-chelate reductase (NADPH) n=1 Tax=Pseudovirgaria hyperparasitica TaxID=470096 RepID=A0A6A6VSC7_9PEZI|nr:uncharacterized protein EJ05DRAFT_505837 [Pseudovirgaria hyperparasitica]KAF2752664.1 hypothetical protein EJ05DRAFT_505837 [Pseudovirgaria hyperparasitica]
MLHVRNSTAVFKVFISPKKIWQVAPGQYVYISMPGIARHRFGFLQSHPYLIAWQLPNKDLILLVSRQSGFSNDLITSTPQSTLVLDGPYGSPYNLGHYDKVIFFAQGIGIAAHLLTIKSLLYANNQLTARIRRLILIWFLEDKDLDEKEKRHIFNICLYAPYEAEGDVQEGRRGLYVMHEKLDFSRTIIGEEHAEAGSMAISVCGSVSRTLFEKWSSKAEMKYISQTLGSTLLIPI